jgi:predicted acetyltransferase
MDGVDLRPIAGDEALTALFDLDELTFHAAVPAAHRVHHAHAIRREQTLCAYDGGRLVGSSVVYPQTLSVPGGALPAGAVSWVSVAPTHRRRGVMRAMMEGQLRRMSAAGLPFAVLWAAESTLYAANAGRWRLELGADGGRCTPTGDPADLVLPVAELGAAYLGGGSLVRAVDAGVVAEPTPGAAAAFDQAARAARAPWNVAVF